MISSSFPDPPAVMVPSMYYGHDLAGDAYGGRRMFKKHKVLPRPDRDRAHAVASFAYGSWPEKAEEDYLTNAARPDKKRIHLSSPSQAPDYPPRTIHSGPKLPPTPPAPSQDSSSSLSGLPSTSLWAVSSLDTDGGAPGLSPVTPTNEQGPPTPDVTPPRRVARPTTVRALQSDRTPSKSASDSRSGSFRTAREEPYTSEDERSLAHPALPSARTSQSTVRHVGKDDETPVKDKQPKGQARIRKTTGPDATPRSKIHPVTFGDEWQMNTGDTEVVQEWDGYLQRHVKVRKSRPYPDPTTPSPGGGPGADIREDAMVTPTNATRAVRAMRLHAPSEKRTSSNSVTDPEKEGADSSLASSPTTTDSHRLSGLSAKSGVSTVVEAVLVDSAVPQRRRTLRHVKKRTALRNSNPDVSHGSSAPGSSTTLQEASVRPSQPRRPADGRRNNRVSSTSVNSTSSAKALKEVWNQGAIPVVVVPDRKSSIKKSGEPILRSTSSRRSRRSASLTSAPLSSGSASKEGASTSERLPRHGRSVSEAAGSDVRTIDYPPVVPKRTSSLSAPTSQSASRTGSLTADSLKAHNALVEAETLEHANKPEVKTVENDDAGQRQQSTLQPPEDIRQAAASVEDEVGSRRFSLGDPVSGKRVSSQNTPFSLASMETCGTAPEVSEALAVNIYAHQNTSVLMVDHGSSKPSHDSEIEVSKEFQCAGIRSSTDKPQPTITTTASENDEPATPPQQHHGEEGVDYSPLRNPRSPPEPPAIKFIPATPSGATPAHERPYLMGNYFEEMEPKPKRSVSLVRRVLPRRRHSESGTSTSRPTLLGRTLSLSRGVRKVVPFATERSSDKALPDLSYPTAENRPADDRLLHPFWQPAHPHFDSDSNSNSSSEDDADFNNDGQYERVYRYPPIDNRPRRSLSQRLKRTFAVLPLDDDVGRQFDDTTALGTERRTIGRTPSGNLRVVRRRWSPDEDGENPQHDLRPYTAPDSPDPTPSFWHGYRRGNPARLSEEEERSFLPTLGSKIGSLPRRLSERRREKRTTELRRQISGPREVRDGVGEVIQRGGYRV
ncbi:hypothetical protein VUR80DRAFT_8186 [Thermomyces stellatus]